MFKSSNQTSARPGTTCDDIGRKLIQPTLYSGGRALQTSIATIDLFHTPTIPNIEKFNESSKRKFKPIIPNSANNCRQYKHGPIKEKQIGGKAWSEEDKRRCRNQTWKAQTKQPKYRMIIQDQPTNLEKGHKAKTSQKRHHP